MASVRERDCGISAGVRQKDCTIRGNRRRQCGAGVHETLHVVHELLLVRYVLYHIAEHDEVELAKVFRAHLIYIVTDKVHAVSVRVVGKACLTHVYLGLVDVNTHTFATHIQEWKQVSRFTTAYLQDAHGGGDRALLLNVRNHIAAHTFRLLVEVSVVVFVTLLHSLTICILIE